MRRENKESLAKMPGFIKDSPDAESHQMMQHPGYLCICV